MKRLYILLLATNILPVGFASTATQAADSHYEILIKAMRNNDLEEVKRLLRAEINPNSQNQDGDTALHEAVGMDRGAIIKLLLESGANPNIQDKHGATPLFEASSISAIELLINNGADPKIQNKNGCAALNYLLVHEDGHIDFDGSCLEDTLGDGDTIDVLLQFLLKSGLDVNAEAYPLFWAVFLGSTSRAIRATRFLLSHGANPNAKFYPDKILPGETYSLAELKYPINYAEYAAAGSTALHFAIGRSIGRSSVEEIINLLINYGANLDAQDEEGRTPLHIAVFLSKIGRFYFERFESANARVQSAKAIKILLAHGANPNIQDELGMTPLHMAACVESAKAIKILLAHGANPNIQDKYGRRPSDLTNEEKIKRLLQ